MNRLITIVSLILLVAAICLGIWLWNDLDVIDKYLFESDNTTTSEPVEPIYIAPSFTDIKPIDAYADKIPTEDVFLLADLHQKTVQLYNDGELIRQADILSQGSDGSFWETPTGLYEIQYRNENHVSSIGNVNMPYSMQYSGNFFIHGWPTHLDGSDVSPGYSGGCIRLDTAGAASLFPYTKWGTSLLVVDSSTLQSTYQIDLDQKDYELLENLSAKGVIIANSNSGEVYYIKNQQQYFDLGSINNFLIAFAANENISYSSKIPEYAKVGSEWIKNGNQYVLEVRYPTLLTESGDQDVISIVRYRGKETFVDYLDRKTSAIGMVQTEHNFSKNNTISTNSRLIDWYHLARYLYHQKPFMLEVSPEVVKNGRYRSYVTTTSNGDSAFNYIEINAEEYSESIIVILTDSEDINSDFAVIKSIFK